MVVGLVCIWIVLGGVEATIDLYANGQLELSFDVVPLTTASFDPSTTYLLLPSTLLKTDPMLLVEIVTKNRTAGQDEAILVLDMIQYLPQLVPYLSLTKGLLTSYLGSDSLTRAVMFDHQILSFPLPVGIIRFSDLLRIISLMSLPNTTITFLFNSYDQNDWLHFTQVGGRSILCSFLILSDLLCLSFALYNLHLKAEFSLGTLCLSLEAAFNFTRLGYLFMNAADMAFGKDNYHIFAGLYLICFPFTFASGILLVFFWIDATSKTLYHGTFLDKLLKPTLCFITISFVMCWSAGICSFLQVLSNEASFSLSVTLDVLVFTVAMIYFYAAFRVYRFANEGNMNPDRKALIMKMMWKIVICGVIVVLEIVCAVAFVFTSSLVVYYLCFFLMDLLLSALSAIQISFFGGQQKANTNVHSSSVKLPTKTNSASAKTGSGTIGEAD